MDRKKLFFRNKKSEDAEKRKESSIYKFLDKEGFYIILFLCVCIVATTAVWVTKTNIDRLAVDDLQRPMLPFDEELPDSGTATEAQDEAPVVVVEEKEDAEEVMAKQEAQTPVQQPVKQAAKPVKQTSAKPAAVPANAAQTATAKTTFKMPVVGEKGMDYAANSLVYSKTLDHYTTHYGVDIIAPENTPVVAALAGEVIEVVVDSRMGITITIAHEGELVTKYANLSTGSMVKVGDKVEKGQIISGVGRSALFEISEEPHLHFEVLVDGEHVDPNKFLPKN
ncbi:Murein DD-endopeptidase MepM and murein hydrolase activator NlpD, contain LysM domain [Geosporobacter subterraneus DSM 17957]|uniref:Murein DD-endopeptidase MepM and murein hydrolase activator NlpD, contain LysM domain n=1 Tax=Geosporobacter subterraneus DSM 17957 TaxID=1121919 RepID=A0A1M6CI29_9FIRM|nr:M23 family metallopeptidase [Geosporobacter subterraneus]SHI60680.1 Murein DD-endopeptidase MepM and murein hydrolase activator NlpD, contain LysM domain [Geosporobacter subterraneus DSM 17957]